MRQLCLSLIVPLALLLATPASAENAHRAGELTVHYNALPSTTLTPDIAKAYGLTRSANRALINIAVRRGTMGADQAQAATVNVQASNLAGQRQAVTMREVREGEAIYYLGEARITPPENMLFEVDIVVAGEPPIRFQFRQDFVRL